MKKFIGTIKKVITFIRRARKAGAVLVKILNFGASIYSIYMTVDGIRNKTA